MIMIYVETVNITGQRSSFKWSVYQEAGDNATLVNSGDSYYKWNAKRAARRAARRYLDGTSEETIEIYTEAFDPNAT